MEKIFETEKEIEVLAGNGSAIAWVKGEDPKRFSVCRGKKYQDMGWEELTLEEQIAVEQFN
jgi:hypothetical protein